MQQGWRGFNHRFCSTIMAVLWYPWFNYSNNVSFFNYGINIVTFFLVNYRVYPGVKVSCSPSEWSVTYWLSHILFCSPLLFYYLLLYRITVLATLTDFPWNIAVTQSPHRSPYFIYLVKYKLCATLLYIMQTWHVLTVFFAISNSEHRWKLHQRGVLFCSLIYCRTTLPAYCKRILSTPAHSWKEKLIICLLKINVETWFCVCVCVFFCSLYFI